MAQELELKCEPERSAELAPLIDAVVAEVLATMFFTDAEAVPCDTEWLATAVCVRLQFEGTHQGEVCLCISREAADAVACAFLGSDYEETTEAERGHVILELTNILCGAVLSRIWPESRLLLSPPVAATWSADLPASLHRSFTMPEGHLALSIRIAAGNRHEGCETEE